MPLDTAEKKGKRKTGFQKKTKTRMGIVLVIVGIILLASPWLTDLYTNWQQGILLREYEGAFDKLPGIDFLPAEGAPTGFENVILKVPKNELEVAVIAPPTTIEELDRLNRKGPVFFRSSAMPGAKETVAIIAHRNVYGGHFKNIHLIGEGDKIYLDTPQRNYIYSFVESIIVDINDDEKMEEIFDVEPENHRLLLTTCEHMGKNPHWDTPYRLIVVANLEKVEYKQE